MHKEPQRKSMLELRPRWESSAAVIDLIDASLRPAGYRLVRAFNGDPDALAVAGFREVRALAWGHYLYVDGNGETTSQAEGSAAV